jgi:putative ABC transport system permease protein
VALRGLFSRKLRTVLTMIAIILGVSMIAGTYILTDTINQSFSKIFHQANSTTDAVILGKKVVDSQFSPPPTLPASLLTVVQHTPGVAAAEGVIADRASLVDRNGHVIGATGGAPSLLFSRSIPRFSQLKLVQGREPGTGEIAVDKDTASKHHLRLGQQVGVVGVGAVRHFTLVGIVKFGTVSSIGGAAIISMTLPDAEQVTGKVGRFDQIRVAAAPGVSPTDLVGRLQARIPPNLRSSVKVQTGTQNADQTSSDISKALSFLTTALLAFGGIALFVGAFVIFNTFSITVAQRTREFALLRTVGATRAQVLRSVIFEALLVGFVASVLGLLLGIGLAKGLNSLFVAFGIDLPNAGTVIAARTVIVALVVGTLVTLIASLNPAIRSTRVPPIAALREGFKLPRGRFSRFVPAISVLLVLAGLALLTTGIFASISSAGQRLSLIGFGALLLFLGAAMFSPQLVRPLASVIGWPMQRLTNITGRLARENAVRNPSRTAVTAAALMIGLALVGFVTIFAAELKKTADDAVNREVAGTYIIYDSNGQLIPAGAAAVAARVPGVSAVSSVKVDAGHLQGIGDVQTNGIQPSSITRIYHFQWKQGSDAVVTHMGPHDAIVDEGLAKDNHLHLGSLLHVTTPAATHDTFRVVGVYKTSQFLVNWCIPYTTMGVDWRQPRDFAVVVGAAPGQNLKALEKRLSNALVGQYPTATVHSQQDLKNQNDKQVNQLLALIYVLLAMSVLVSLFGIINTLVLSVYERTREIGMLRAIGTTRTQVRWIIRWESVITAVIGAIIGLLLGIVLAVMITAGLSSQGIEYALPVGQLLIWVVFAMLFGIFAAAWPARRAARLDVLQAVAYE